jgi:predicted porin
MEYIGLGLHYFFSKNTAFTMEGRYRHLSNADIKRPKTGINSYFILIGLSYLF